MIDTIFEMECQFEKVKLWSVKNIIDHIAYLRGQIFERRITTLEIDFIARWESVYSHYQRLTDLEKSEAVKIAYCNKVKQTICNGGRWTDDSIPANEEAKKVINYLLPVEV